MRLIKAQARAFLGEIKKQSAWALCAVISLERCIALQPNLGRFLNGVALRTLPWTSVMKRTPTLNIWYIHVCKSPISPKTHVFLICVGLGRECANAQYAHNLGLTDWYMYFNPNLLWMWAFTYTIDVRCEKRTSAVNFDVPTHCVQLIANPNTSWFLGPFAGAESDVSWQNRISTVESVCPGKNIILRDIYWDVLGIWPVHLISRYLSLNASNWQIETC